MFSIRKKLSIILVICTAAAILLSAILVNVTVNRKFDEYVSDISSKKEQRMIDYFVEVYKNDNKWTKDSGVEISHEAYMDNFCLTLRDSNKNIIWTMDPSESRFKEHFAMMQQKNDGIYNVKSHEIKLGDTVVGYVDIGQYSPVFITEEDKNFKGDINEGIIIGAVLAVLVAVGVSLILSKQFSAPISAVSDTSVKLSNGDYDARSEGNSNIKELKNLTDSINILGERLKQQDSMRKRLVSDISHEIRTPLNVLQNNLEAMVDGIVPVTDERLISLNNEVIRFGKLLENLNILKGFEDGDVALSTSAFDLGGLVSSVVRDFGTVLNEKKMKMIYDPKNEENFLIKGDSDKLKQVFVNILSNAVKFSEHGSSIWVIIDGDERNVTVKLKDEGIGIDKRDLPYIFDRLYRADKSREVIEGSGIGLSIVKKILMLHNAGIRVISEPGRGTEVIMTFNRIFHDN